MNPACHYVCLPRCARALFCVSIFPLDDLMWVHGFAFLVMLRAPEFMFPPLFSAASSRLLIPTAYLMTSLGYLMVILNLTRLPT